ncbi:MAG: hypothetical protein R3Y36_08400 [Spirochaetales bacterium]
MTDTQWQTFCAFKDDFKQKIDFWHTQLQNANLHAELKKLQQNAAEKDGVPPYEISHPFVYNRSLDDIKKTDTISLIMIGDNPGKNEQLAENRRYLVGQSGKIAENFFARNPELHTDFRKNVIILNKTPLHTAKTKELVSIRKSHALFDRIITESQLWFAESTAKLHRALCEDSDTPCELWIVGYAELKGRGLFTSYRDALFNAYNDFAKSAWQYVFVYQHFSMNRFLIDLKQRYCTDLSLKENLKSVGAMHRKEIFGE